MNVRVFGSYVGSIKGLEYGIGHVCVYILILIEVLSYINRGIDTSIYIYTYTYDSYTYSNVRVRVRVRVRAWVFY